MGWQLPSIEGESLDPDLPRRRSHTLPGVPRGKPFWGSTPSTVVTSVGAFLTMRATSVH
jgi:hypothetical protein